MILQRKPLFLLCFMRDMRFFQSAKKSPGDFDKLMRAWERGKLRTKDFIEASGLSESTLYRRLRERSAWKGR